MSRLSGYEGFSFRTVARSPTRTQADQHSPRRGFALFDGSPRHGLASLPRVLLDLHQMNSKAALLGAWKGDERAPRGSSQDPAQHHSNVNTLAAKLPRGQLRMYVELML
jgi:hypothetical protein